MKKPVTLAKSARPEVEPEPEVEIELAPKAKAKPAPKAKPMPAIGEVVHFYTRNPNRQYHGSEGPYAAIVTWVPGIPESVGEDLEPGISLIVFPVGDPVYMYNVTDVYSDNTGQNWWVRP